MNNPVLTMLNASGAPVPAPTTSLDLPPALASILSMGSSAPAGAPMQPNMGTGMSSGMMGTQSFVPSYQAGGMIGAGGMPEPMGVGLAPQGQMPQGPMDPKMLQMELNRFATQQPQQLAQIRQTMLEAMQSGELTPQELNMTIQLATVAAQNPEMYPSVRRFAIQQGIAEEDDLPQQYDQGLIFMILLAARALQADMGGQSMLGATTAPQVASGPMPSMAKGGTVPDSRKSDGSVLINAHEGEYVIPAHIVKAKGTEFFDKLIGKDTKA